VSRWLGGIAQITNYELCVEAWVNCLMQALMAGLCLASFGSVCDSRNVELGPEQLRQGLPIEALCVPRCLILVRRKGERERGQPAKCLSAVEGSGGVQWNHV
jgi:hypothetical protein